MLLIEACHGTVKSRVSLAARRSREHNTALSYATCESGYRSSKVEVKSRYEIEAKTLEHRNTTDEREVTSATGQPKHALEALRSKMLELMDEAGLTAQVLIEKYLDTPTECHYPRCLFDRRKFLCCQKHLLSR